MASHTTDTSTGRPYPEHIYKDSLWVKTNVRMSYCEIFRCNVNSRIHWGTRTYVMISHESNIVGVFILFPLWCTLASFRLIVHHSPLRLNQFAPTRNHMPIISLTYCRWSCYNWYVGALFSECGVFCWQECFINNTTISTSVNDWQRIDKYTEITMKYN